MKKRRLCLSLPLVAAAFVLMAGEAPAAGSPLTLPEAISSALKNNATLQVLRVEQGIGEAATLRAGLYPNPTLEAEGATGALTGSSSESSLSLGVSQQIVTAGKRGKRLAVARGETALAAARLNEAERQVVREVKEAFHQAVRAEGLEALAREAHELNLELLRISQERFKAGEVAELDAYLARVEVARGEARLVESQRDVTAARLALFTLLGAPAGEEPALQPAGEGAFPAGSIAELKALALERRADLRALDLERTKAEAELTLARAEGVPDVTAELFVSREGSTDNGIDGEEKETDYLVGVRLSVPLALWDRNQGGVGEALARKGSAEARYGTARVAAGREVEGAYARLRAARRQVELFERDILPRLAANLKLVQEAYRLGEGSVQALIEEQRKFLEVKAADAEARFASAVALAQLEAVVGDLPQRAATKNEENAQ